MIVIIEDLKYAVRLLRRQPGFTFLAVLILCIGIGGNTAIFSVVNTVLLRPLPYEDPGRLYFLWTRNLERQQARGNFSAPEYLDYAARAESFTQISAHRFYSATLTGLGEPQRVMTMLVTPNYFELLGIQPSLGRSFTAGEGQHGQGQLVVLSSEFWHTRFGSDPEILGRTLMLDNEPHEVVGIMPAVPGGMHAPDLYFPAAFTPEELATREARYLSVMARLRDGVTAQQAEQELAAIAAGLRAEHPRGQRGWDSFLTQAHGEFTGEARHPLGILFGAVGFVLVIACANLANLLLVRASARRKEIAVRASLGAGQRRIFRGMLAESLVLSLAGGVAGVALAWVAIRGIVRWNVVSLPRLQEASLDTTALLFNFAIALLAGILFGVGPAWRALQINLAATLRDEGRGSSGSLRRSRGRAALVIAEVALSVVLLVGAGLLLRTFAGLSRIDPGFRGDSVLTLRTTLPEARYPDVAARANYVRRAAERLETLPGVRSAGMTTALPMMQVNWMAEFTIDGLTDPAGRAETATYNAISPHFFESIGAVLVKGRHFSDADNDTRQKVVIISETLEKTFFLGTDPLGRFIRMKVSRFECECQIVGVVRDIRHLRLDEPPRVAIYQPHAQLPWPFLAFAIRTEGNPAAMATAVRKAFAEVDPELPVDRVMPLGQLVDRTLARQRLAMVLLALFSGVAVLLSAVGLYGVIAVSVQQRAREFGIRMALGATAGQVLRHVVGQGLVLTIAGLAVGLLAAPLATRLMKQMLYGVEHVDAVTFAAVSLMLPIIAVLACLPPAWRAARTDPGGALRSE